MRPPICNGGGGGAFVTWLINFSRERSQSVKFLCICNADLKEIDFKNMVHHIHMYTRPTICISGTHNYDDEANHHQINKIPVICALGFGDFFFAGGGWGWLVFAVFFFKEGGG